MVKKSRPTIAFLTHSISDAYGGRLWAGAMDAAREGNANFICYPGWAPGSPRGFEAQANVIYDFITSESVDGIVLSGGIFSEFIGKEELEKFCEQYRPLPMVSVAVALKGIPSVLAEDYQGIGEVISHLVEEHNIHRIAFLTKPTKNPQARLRYDAYIEALAKHGLTLDPRLIAPDAEWREYTGSNAIRWLLDEQRLVPGDDFQAVVAGNDNLAYGALVELQSRGIRVPEDVALTGFDAHEGSKYLTPPLTSVYTPVYEQARKAIEVVLAQIRGEKVISIVHLPTRLIVKQSCGCLNPLLMQDKVGMETEPSKAIETALDASRKTIGHQKLLKRAVDSAIAVSPGVMERVLGALRDELKEKSQGIFLSTLEGALGETVSADGDLSIWQDAIFVMRQRIVPDISDALTLTRLEHICQHARTMITEEMLRVQGYRRMQAELRTATLNEINQALISTSDAKELMTILADGLPKLKIPGCFVSLYENPTIPTDGCQLILAYKEGRVESIVSRHIASKRLAPDDMLLQDRPYNLVVEPMYFRENQIGIAVFEVGQRDGAIYETLRGQLSSALWGSRLVQYLKSLYEASGMVISLQDPEVILQDVVDQACKVVGAKWADIVLVDKHGRPQRLVVGGSHGSLLETSSLVSNEPILVEDLQVQTSPKYRQMAQEGVGAVGSFPLHLRGRLVGSLWIFYEKPHRFSDIEVDALRLYANQAAIAYDNARRTKELIHLRQAAEKLAQVAEVKQVLQQIVESARDIFEADSAVIWSYDAARHVFLPDELVADGVTPDVLEKFRKDAPRREGTAIIVMQRGYLAVTNVEDAKYDYLKAPIPRLRHAITVKSYQGVALKVEDESLGVLYVNHQQPRGFDEEDETTLKTLAYDAALALKKARLLERLKRGHESARIIAEASVLENLQATLSAIAKGTRDALLCDAVTLYTYNQEKDEIGFPPTMVGIRQEVGPLKYKYVAKDSVIYNVLKRNEIYVAEDVSRDPVMRNRSFISREGIKSLVSLPLIVSNHKVGVMFVNFRDPHHFTAEELSDIELFADQAAVAIRNAQLYEDVTKTNSYLQAFYDAGKAMSGTLALGEILDRITKQALLITGRTGGPKARFSYLALVEGNKLKMMSAFPNSYLEELERVFDDLDFEHDKPIGITGRAVKLGKTQLANDIAKHPDYISGHPGIGSELAVPIKSGEQVIGVIDVEHQNFDAFDEGDKQALEALAAQAAIAIQNARQYEELEKTKGLIGARTAVAWMGMASSTWRHAIGNYATTIEDLAELARRDIATDAPAEKINVRLNNIKDMVGKIRGAPITAPLQAEEGVSSVSINDFLKERIGQLWKREPNQNVSLKFDLGSEDSATVRVSPDWLRRALDILIDNAIEAMSDTVNRQLTVSTQLTNNFVEVAITDTGRGIPKSVSKKLFQTAITKSKGSKGLGVGLLMASTIIQTYGGDISVKSTGPSGTTMSIRLPVER